MSERPELSEAEAFAAEHALGLLTSAERRQAETRMARDAVFAGLVEAWRNRLDSLIDAIMPITPSHGVWAGIEQTLPVNDNAADSRGLRFWRAATVGSLTLAAASLTAAVFLANQPPVIIHPVPVGQLLNASLISPSGAPVPLFVAAYDPVRKALIVTSLVQPGKDPAHVHELWVIPADGKPRPLGFIEPGKTKTMPMPEALRNSLALGSAIAVTVEPPGGSPKIDAPSGPVAAVGKLVKI